MQHRDIENVKKIGVDEIQVFRGHQYFTLVYQIDQGMRRLLWCAQERKAKTLLAFFHWFGKERSNKLEFVCSDMWPAYISVIRKKASNALNILDRFHIMKKFNEAIDQVRRNEVRKLKEEGKENVLIGSRWLLLKKPANLTEKQTAGLDKLLKINLNSIKAYLMREDFQRFWEYKNPLMALKFMEDWAEKAIKSDIDPMKKVAKMLEKHKELIANWFKSDEVLSSGVVEGLNLKAKLTMRKAFGYKSPEVLRIALYHTMGNLPEPEGTHRFC